MPSRRCLSWVCVLVLWLTGCASTTPPESTRPEANLTPQVVVPLPAPTRDSPLHVEQILTAQIKGQTNGHSLLVVMEADGQRLSLVEFSRCSGCGCSASIMGSMAFAWSSCPPWRRWVPCRRPIRYWPMCCSATGPVRAGRRCCPPDGSSHRYAAAPRAAQQVNWSAKLPISRRRGITIRYACGNMPSIIS